MTTREKFETIVKHYQLKYLVEELFDLVEDDPRVAEWINTVWSDFKEFHDIGDVDDIH